MEEGFGPSRMFVIGCNTTRVDTRDISIDEFIDYEEDMQGADVLTWICSTCGQVHSSRVYRHE